MDNVETDLNKKWLELAKCLDIDMETLCSPISSPLVNKPIELTYLDECRQWIPHIKDIEFVLCGSRKEESWVPKFFKGEFKSPLYETDLLCLLKQQTLSSDEKELLILNKERPGFVAIRYPERNWLNHFAVSECEEKGFLVSQNNTLYVSGIRTKEWTKQIVDACNPLKDIKFKGYEKLPTEIKEFIDQMSQLSACQKGGEQVVSGPATNLSLGNATSETAVSLFNQFSSIVDMTNSQHLDLIIESYSLCLEMNTIVQTTLGRIIGIQPKMCTETGTISLAKIEETEPPSINCESSNIIGSLLKHVYGELFELFKKLFHQIQKIIRGAEKGECLYLKRIIASNLVSPEELCGIDNIQNFMAYAEVKVFESFVLPTLTEPNELNDKDKIMECFTEVLNKYQEIQVAIEKEAIGIVTHQDGKTILQDSSNNNYVFMNMKYETDFVFAIACNFWPDVASEWLTRDRPSGFPSAELCTEIANGGVHLVPKSYPGGDEDLNWRFSFSVAESKIIEERTSIQRLAYFILKSIYFDHLQIDDAEGDKISSFCFKTIMMWACEKYPSEYWREDNFANCVLSVFDDFIEALKTRRLPHYFIPEINLLKDNSQDVIDMVLQKAEEVRKNPHSFPESGKIDKIVSLIKHSKKFRQVTSTFQGEYRLRLAEGLQVSLEDYHNLNTSFFEKVCEKLPFEIPSEGCDVITNVIMGKGINKTAERKFLFPFETLFGIHHETLEHFSNIVTKDLEQKSILSTKCVSGEQSDYIQWVDKLECIITNTDVLTALDNCTNNTKSIAILKETVPKSYLMKLIKYLIGGNSHFVVSGICQFLNYAKILLHHLHNAKGSQSETINGLMCQCVKDWNKELAVISCYVRESGNEDKLSQTSNLKGTENKENLAKPTERIETVDYVDETEKRKATDFTEIDEKELDEVSTTKGSDNIVIGNKKVETEETENDDGDVKKPKCADEVNEAKPSDNDWLDVSDTLDFEAFSTKIIVDILLQIEKVITKDTFSPPGIALIALVGEIQLTYQDKLLKSLKTLRDEFLQKQQQRDELLQKQQHLYGDTSQYNEPELD